MPEPKLKRLPSEGLRDELEALPGVLRAVIDGPPYRIDLICDPTPTTPPVEAAVHALLAKRGVESEPAELRFSYLAGSLPRRRVRFVAVDVQRPRIGTVAAVVRLEWEGQTFSGAAEGDGGGAGELRVCALAAVRAIEAVLEGQVSFSLVGTKETRIFDHDLVAVLLQSEEVPDRRLLGVSLVTADSRRSAALAVLNATNRLLGNYLAASD